MGSGAQLTHLLLCEQSLGRPAINSAISAIYVDTKTKQDIRHHNDDREIMLTRDIQFGLGLCINSYCVPGVRFVAVSCMRAFPLPPCLRAVNGSVVDTLLRTPVLSPLAAARLRKQ